MRKIEVDAMVTLWGPAEAAKYIRGLAYMAQSGIAYRLHLWADYAEAKAIR